MRMARVAVLMHEQSAQQHWAYGLNVFGAYAGEILRHYGIPFEAVADPAALAAGGYDIVVVRMRATICRRRSCSGNTPKRAACSSPMPACEDLPASCNAPKRRRQAAVMPLRFLVWRRSRRFVICVRCRGRRPGREAGVRSASARCTTGSRAARSQRRRCCASPSAAEAWSGGRSIFCTRSLGCSKAPSRYWRTASRLRTAPRKSTTVFSRRMTAASSTGNTTG